MITRPLDLASKLQRPPRSLDAFFWVNAGLLVGFFFWSYSSRFVLAPGLAVDFQLPRIHGAAAGAAPTTHQITVEPSGLIVIDDGPANLQRLGEWLKEKAKAPGAHTLLVKASVGVPMGEVGEIFSAARAAGFEVLLAAEETAPPAGGH